MKFTTTSTSTTSLILLGLGSLSSAKIIQGSSKTCSVSTQGLNSRFTYGAVYCALNSLRLELSLTSFDRYDEPTERQLYYQPRCLLIRESSTYIPHPVRHLCSCARPAVLARNICRWSRCTRARFTEERAQSPLRSGIYPSLRQAFVRRQRKLSLKRAARQCLTSCRLDQIPLLCLRLTLRNLPS